MESGRSRIFGVMGRILLVLLLLGAIGAAAWYFRPAGRPSRNAERAGPKTSAHAEEMAARAALSSKAAQAKRYSTARGFSQRVAFLADMSRHSGRYRFFAYDLVADTILAAGLVAHGSCNMGALQDVSFSPEPGCGCSSKGRYKIGGVYQGRFGTAFKLHGLDSSNRTAYERSIVLHAYSCVPDREVAPQHICNSLGCPMVSYKFLDKLTGYIRREKKPILLWIYE